MSKAVDIESLKRLTPAEKLVVIEALWNSMDESVDLDASSGVIAEMERRLDWAIANPDRCGSLEEFKARIGKSR